MGEARMNSIYLSSIKGLTAFICSMTSFVNGPSPVLLWMIPEIWLRQPRDQEVSNLDIVNYLPLILGNKRNDFAHE